MVLSRPASPLHNVRRRKSRFGTALIEVALAAVVISIVFQGANVATTATLDHLANARLKSDASELAHTVVDRSRALGCGVGVGSGYDSTADETEQARMCWLAVGASATNHGLTGFEALVPSGNAADGTTGSVAAVTGNSLGDATFTILRSNTRFVVDVKTAWEMPGGGAPAVCSTSASPGPQPVLLRRNVTVSWHSAQRATKALSVVDVQALSPDEGVYNRRSDGGFAVSGLSVGTPVTLRVSGWSAPVVRRASTYGVLGSTQACVWFPYVPSGSTTATYTIGTGAAQSVTLNPAQQRKFP